MEDIRTIQRRIRSIKNTRQITRAMETVAAAKLRKARARAEAARPYAAHLKGVIARILGNAPGVRHPFLQESPSKGSKGYLVITSDRGLNGGYNSLLLRRCLKIMEGDDRPSVMVIGRKGRDYFRYRDIEIRAEYLGVEDHPSWSTVLDMGSRARQFFADGVFHELHLVYNEFVSSLSYRPLVQQLLPLKPLVAEVTAEAELEAYQFEPGPAQALGQLLPRYLNSLIYGAILEARAAEHGARMTAMGSATGNADEIIKKLTLRYNRARQGAITEEILEVISGGESLG